MGILTKYGVRPADGAGSMMKVPGEFVAETMLDVSSLDNESRRQLNNDLKAQGLTTDYDRQTNTLKVSGSVQFFYSRGTDNQGRKAVWLQAEGPMANLIAESLFLIYQEHGWALTSGRILRELVSRVGGEIRLPDGSVIFVGSSEDYASSLLSSDGAFVHPKLGDELKRLIADSDDVEIDDEDPFK